MYKAPTLTPLVVHFNPTPSSGGNHGDVVLPDPEDGEYSFDVPEF